MFINKIEEYKDIYKMDGAAIEKILLELTSEVLVLLSYKYLGNKPALSLFPFYSKLRAIFEDYLSYCFEDVVTLSDEAVDVEKFAIRLEDLICETVRSIHNGWKALEPEILLHEAVRGMNKQK
jgi:hypothetical protein